jgi:hypothetical protein
VNAPPDAAAAVPAAAEGDAGAAGAAPLSRAAADLSAKAVDTIDLIVATVNDKAIRPLLLAGRVLVFGLLAAVLGVLVLVVVSVAVVRLLDVYAFSGRVWAAEALLGAVFVAGGLFAWSKRSAPADGARR